MSQSGFYRHIAWCNQHEPGNFVPFRVDEAVVGRVHRQWLEALLESDQVFVPWQEGLGLHPGLQDYRQRSDAVAEVLAEWVASSRHDYLLGEPYPVTAAGRGDALLEIDRSAASLFGLRTFGQHLNGYVRDGDEWFMWLGRRSSDRRLFPGRLDQLVAGGMPAGIALRDNLIKECHEEAGMEAALAQQARSVGMVSYNADTKKGYKYDILYCYDLLLPEDFAPVCTDGEVESFQLLPLVEVARLVSETDEFKPNCNLVVIDFLLRHGMIGPEHPEYLPLSLGLRPGIKELPEDRLGRPKE